MVLLHAVLVILLTIHCPVNFAKDALTLDSGPDVIFLLHVVRPLIEAILNRLVKVFVNVLSMLCEIHCN